MKSQSIQHLAERKLAVNETKSPAERVRGSSRKYSGYDQGE
jgi:hypothetical protein